VKVIVNLDQLAGFLIGAKSSRFKIFHSLIPEMKQDADQWQYLSLMDVTGVTYDLRFPTLSDSRDFIVAISEAARRCSRGFAGATSHSMVTMLLLRSKLKKMAKLQKTSIQGMLARGIFTAVAQAWPEDTYAEILAKHEKLNMLGGKCFRINAIPTEEQM